MVHGKCCVPFTTTGLSFAVNELYFQASLCSSDLSERCTIHQLYRYTLVQFHRRMLSAGAECVPPFESYYSEDWQWIHEMMEDMMDYPTYPSENSNLIIEIINSYGKFDYNEGSFYTLVPPRGVHSAHNIRLTNLRDIVVKLSAGLDRDFFKENTLPGAIYSTNGLLLNGDAIMPAKYNKMAYETDTKAVLETFHQFSSHNNCKFEKCVGSPSTLVSTLADSYQCDRIPPEEAAYYGPYRTYVQSSDRMWYSIHPVTEEVMNQGILLYCGVWSKILASKWPAFHVRYPKSAKQKIYARWELPFYLYVKLLPQTSVTVMPLIVCPIPFTTTGLAFNVNDLYHCYSNCYVRKTTKFSDKCTIFQLYRYTLMQFHFQCLKTYIHSYQLTSDSNEYFDKTSIWARNDLKHLYVGSRNFRPIAAIINSYGTFEYKGSKFCTVVPPNDLHSPHTVRISNLRRIVEKLAAGRDKDFMNENTLPGAIYSDDGFLLNGDEIMPEIYNFDAFHEDEMAVNIAFSLLRFQYDDDIFGTCIFSKSGECSTLVSTSLINGSCDRIPPVVQDATAAKLVQTSCNRTWYSLYPITDDMMDYGVLAYCGVWSEELSSKWPDFNVRYPKSALMEMQKDWNAMQFKDT